MVVPCAQPLLCKVKKDRVSLEYLHSASGTPRDLSTLDLSFPSIQEEGEEFGLGVPKTTDSKLGLHLA